MNCVCHGLDNAAENALKKAFPSHVDYMASQTYNWFAHSSKRLQAYADIVKQIGFGYPDDDEDGEEQFEESEGKGTVKARTQPLKIISPSLTRWLVHADCIDRILQQYDALSTHFEKAYQNERSYMAKQLRDMYQDDGNRLIFLFLHPILQDLKNVSNHFQSNNADNLRIFSELKEFFLALARRILKPAILHGKSANDLSELDVTTDFCILSSKSFRIKFCFVFNNEVRF